MYTYLYMFIDKAHLYCTIIKDNVVLIVLLLLNLLLSSFQETLLAHKGDSIDFQSLFNLIV